MKTLLRLVLLVGFIVWSGDLWGQVDTATVRAEVDSLVKINRGLVEKQNFHEAFTVIRVAISRAEESLGKMNASYANCMHNYARTFDISGDFPSAEIWYLEAISIKEKVLGKEHPEYANSLNNLGVLYMDMGKDEQALPIVLEAKNIREKIFGKEHSDYATSLQTLANLYMDMGKYTEALPIALESKVIREKIFGKEHPEYANSLINLGVLYSYLGDYEKTEFLYLESKKIWENTLGKDNTEYLLSLNNLGILYSDLGEYEKAIAYYLEAQFLLAKLFTKNHPNYAIILNNLANLYYRIGNFEKAELLHLESISIRNKLLGQEHPNYAASLHNLAVLYSELGMYEKSESLYEKTLTIRKNTLGQDHPDYAVSLENIGILNFDMGNFDKADSLYREALGIYEKAYGKEHPSYIRCLHNLTALYAVAEEYDKAKSLFFEILSIEEKIFGKKNRSSSITLNNLAGVYSSLGDHEKAEQLYLETKTIREEILGKNHPLYIETQILRAGLYEQMNKPSASELLFEEVFELIQISLIKGATFLSEYELSKYIMKNQRASRILLSSITSRLRKGIQTGTLSALSYDNLLFHKGFLISSLNHINILASTFPLTDSLNNQYKSYRRRLATEYSLPISERDSVRIADLEEKANALEKELARSVAGFADAKRQVTWQEVQQRLKPGEAAVEFVHFQFSNPKPTDSILYAALILLPTDTTPHYIPLFEEKQLTDLLEKTGSDAQATSSLYAARSGRLIGDKPAYGTELYNLIWKPLDSLLQKHKVKTVYFSPSGLMHRVAFGALPVDKKKVLSDKYQLHQLGSTRSLVVKTPEPVPQNYTAAVFGGIEYDRSQAIAAADSTAPEITDNRLWTYIDRPRNSTGSGFDALPGTAAEAARLSTTFHDHNIAAQTYTGTSATEEALKTLGRDTVKSPDILHIATHGFFFPDPKSMHTANSSPLGGGREGVPFKWNENPLFRSGLAMAGANQTWTRQPDDEFIPGTVEDGIATAYEISHLNLSNTKLVVLSACESGLGDIKGSEGVYGLQRAFKMAGADYLLVSLWQVPDDETVEFMDHFYKTWLGGKTIHEAFAKAQKKMRRKYKEVYKWGAWVLIE